MMNIAITMFDAIARVVIVLFMMGTIIDMTTSVADAHRIRGSSHLPMQTQDYDVTLPDGSQQVVHLYMDRSNDSHRRRTATTEWDDNNNNRNDNEWNDDKWDVLWDNNQDMGVYIVKHSDGTRNQVRYLVSEEIDNPYHDRQLKDDDNSSRHDDLRQLKDNNGKGCSKNCPPRDGGSGNHHQDVSTTSSGSGGTLDLHQNNNNNNMPLGEYKVILPDGQDQFFSHHHSYSESNNNNNNNLEADLAALASEIFEMLLGKNNALTSLVGDAVTTITTTSGHGRNRELEMASMTMSSTSRRSSSIHPSGGGGSYRLNRPNGEGYHIVTYQVLTDNN